MEISCTTRFIRIFLYDFGINFVIYMDNDVKTTVTLAVFLRLSNRIAALWPQPFESFESANTLA